MNRFLKIVIVASLALFGGGVFSSHVYAQQALCEVTGAAFRPSGVELNDFGDDNRPYLHFDIQTNGNCNRLEVQFLTGPYEDDPNVTPVVLSSYDVRVGPSWNNPTNVPYSSGPNFTLTFLLGEVGNQGASCNSPSSNGQSIPCSIQAKIINRTATWTLTGGQLLPTAQDLTFGQSIEEVPFTQGVRYYCDGSCNTQWGTCNSLSVLAYGNTCPLQTGTINVTTFGNEPVEGATVVGGEFSTTPLAPLPGFSGNPDLGNWLESLFTILIVIAGILALIMIIVGGVTYITSESFGGKGKGKEYIINAIVGLILALGAWVILNTINPDLAEDLNITIPGVALTIDQQAFTEYEDEIQSGQSFVLAGTFQNPQTSAGLSAFLDNVSASNQINLITVNTSSNNMTIASANGSSVSIPVTGLGANGVSEPGQGVEGDRKTPKGNWQISSDIRISEDQNDAQTPRVGNFNMGPAFIGTNIRTPSGTNRGIGIHGNRNNTPGATMGCVRIKNDDVLALARKITPGVSLVIN